MCVHMGVYVNITVHQQPVAGMSTNVLEPYKMKTFDLFDLGLKSPKSLHWRIEDQIVHMDVF